ncbi:MAG TPA: beta-propeller fold lactonase family protein [Chitinophagaceae bacterium]
MKTNKQLIVIAAAVVFCLSCKKQINSPGSDEPATVRSGSLAADAKAGIAGYVYTLSNQASGNQVLVYSRSASGHINFSSSYSTGGNGTGSGLGSQGAVVLSEDKSGLLAVNAGSNSVTSFTVSGGSLEWQSTVSSGGMMPISVTVHDDLVYVLNAGGSGNISGFRLGDDGTLAPIAGSTKPLSSSAAGAAQVSFTADGAVLIITEKMTNKIITYTIDAMDKPAMMHSITSSTPTPFGFAVGKQGIIYVSEAAGGAPGASALSSYHVSENGMIELIEGSVGAGQTAACWVVITNNGKYVYDTNTGSSNVSSYATGKGDLTVLEAIAGTTGAGSSPIDAALSANSKFLYVLNAGTNTISVFEVAGDGSLSSVQTVPGLLAGTVGMAAK